MGFFINTIYFLICNIPLIIFYIIPYGFEVTPQSKYILIPLLILVGPALTALYGSMGYIVRNKDANFFTYYFKSYKEGFRQSVFIWIIGMALIIMFVVDMNYVAKISSQKIFTVIFGICIGVIILSGLYSFPIISRFKLRTRDVFRLAIFYAVTKIKRTVLIILIFILGLYIIGLSPAYTLPFFPSVFCYLSMQILKPVLEEIKTKIVPKESSTTKESY